MIKTNDLLLTLNALEFMSKGYDISSLTYEDYKTKFLNDKGGLVISTSKINDFTFDIRGIKDFCSLSCDTITRHNAIYQVIEDAEINLTLTLEMFKETMKVLINNKVTTYEGVDREIYDDSFLEYLNNIRESFDRTAPISNSMMKDLSKEKTRKNFITLVSVAYNSVPEIKHKMIEAFDKQYDHFNIEGFQDYPVYDNRLYIPLSEADKYDISKYFANSGNVMDDVDKSMDYIVISKNLYDYFFCSWGSEFQSCFSLSSQHCGWFGMLPFGILPNHYIVYGTKKEAIKVSMDNSGKKWVAPYMHWRSWGWIEKESKQLMLDRTFTNRSALVHASYNLLKNLRVIVDYPCSSISRKVLGSAAFKKMYSTYRLRFYPDSILVSDWSFKRGNGTRSFSGDNLFNFERCPDLRSALLRIVEVDDIIESSDSVKIINSVLSSFKVCPKTGLLIPSNQEASVYSKYFLSPVEHSCILTWIDGKVCVTDATENCNLYESDEFKINLEDCDRTYHYCLTKYESYDVVNLKVFKEKIKSIVNKSIYQVILLRVVKNDTVTVIKYKKDGVR